MFLIVLRLFNYIINNLLNICISIYFTFIYQVPSLFFIFFNNFSIDTSFSRYLSLRFTTFLGQLGIYLENLYIKSEMRGKGLGKIMLSFLAKLAVERNCGRLEWSCLDWNEPSIKFYKRLGVVPMDEWTVYRVNDKALTDLAKSFDD
jgi:RimJ/RimL family protein N-acetyltransferase